MRCGTCGAEIPADRFIDGPGPMLAKPEPAKVVAPPVVPPAPEKKKVWYLRK